MIDRIIKVLRERANLFRAQVQPGSNIFDQAASTIEQLQRENSKLQGDLTFTENLLKMFGEISLAELSEDIVDVDKVKDDLRILSKEVS